MSLPRGRLLWDPPWDPADFKSWTWGFVPRAYRGGIERWERWQLDRRSLPKLEGLCVVRQFRTLAVGSSCREPSLLCKSHDHCEERKVETEVRFENCRFASLFKREATAMADA